MTTSLTTPPAIDWVGRVLALFPQNLRGIREFGPTLLSRAYAQLALPYTPSQARFSFHNNNEVGAPGRRPGPACTCYTVWANLRVSPRDVPPCPSPACAPPPLDWIHDRIEQWCSVPAPAPATAPTPASTAILIRPVVGPSVHFDASGATRPVVSEGTDDTSSWAFCMLEKVTRITVLAVAPSSVRIEVFGGPAYEHTEYPDEGRLEITSRGSLIAITIYMVPHATLQWHDGRCIHLALSAGCMMEEVSLEESGEIAAPPPPALARMQLFASTGEVVTPIAFDGPHVFATSAAVLKDTSTGYHLVPAAGGAYRLVHLAPCLPFSRLTQNTGTLLLFVRDMRIHVLQGDYVSELCICPIPTEGRHGFILTNKQRVVPETWTRGASRDRLATLARELTTTYGPMALTASKQQLWHVTALTALPRDCHRITESTLH